MSAALRPLAWFEIRRYLRHPLFLLGVVVNVAVTLAPVDPRTSVALNGIIPAAATGLLGIVIMASLTRRSDELSRAAGAPPARERTRTLALVAACVVPLTLGVLWWIWAVIMLGRHPPPAYGYPFGGVSRAWIDAVMFGQGTMACLGGPLLGLVVGRWARGRGTPALVAVLVLAFCIVMQPLVADLRRIRVLSPWTHFGGPIGIPGDNLRALILSGSPSWWVAYLAGLCALGAIAALLHDREAPRRRLWAGAAAVGAVTVTFLMLAMWTGTPHTIVNPLPSGA